MFSFYNGQHASPFHGERGTSAGCPLSPPPPQPSPTFSRRESSSHMGSEQGSLPGPRAHRQLEKWPPSVCIPTAGGRPGVLGHQPQGPPPLLVPILPSTSLRKLFTESLIIDTDTLAQNTLPIHHSVRR